MAHSTPPPELHAGDKMTQSEFHIAYDRMPEGYRAELIAGVVYEPPRTGIDHGDFHSELSGILRDYRFATPGVQTLTNATVILSNRDELEPDIVLRVLPDRGGSSRNETWPSSRSYSGINFIAGAPELIAEVAHSSKRIDLVLKKRRYALGGVKEYIVLTVDPPAIHWFRRNRRIEPENGVFRSLEFPGLWIDADALLSQDYERVRETLNLGLASDEHKQFVADLAARRR